MKPKADSRPSTPMPPIARPMTIPSEFTNTVMGNQRKPKARAADCDESSTTVGKVQPSRSSQVEGGELPLVSSTLVDTA